MKIEQRKRAMYYLILFTFLFNLIITVYASEENCGKDQYDICVRIADPLVKEAHLVVPDNLDDIDLVCRIWNRFVDCLRSYTDNCFNAQEKQRFNSAVESPIESVHQMCMQPNYQKEYLKHAPCIKTIIVERAHCGLHYNLLVDQAEKDNFDSKSTLCCSHDRFKQCVQRETRKMCDKELRNGPAAKFAVQIIDKALRFLEEQCINYIPNSGDCLIPQDTATISQTLHSDPTTLSVVVNAASSEIYPWNVNRQEIDKAKEISPLRNMPKPSTDNWPISSTSSTNDNNWKSSSTLPPPHLGSRNRPSSYGRSKTWTTESSSTNTVWSSPDLSTKQNDRQDYPGRLSTTSRWNSFDSISKYDSNNNLYDLSTYKPSTVEQSKISSIPPSVTSPSSHWNNPSSIFSTTSETWYPAAGNQLTNEVDEPNQLGLTKSQNSNALIIVIDQYCFVFSIGLNGAIIILKTLMY